MHSFIRKQDAINNQNAQTFSDLKDTLAKIAYALIIQEKRKFPVQPQPNPKIQNAPIDQVKLVITFQSGKVIDRPIPEPCENENSKGKEELDKLTPSEKITNVPSEPLFPHALNKPRKSNHSSVIYEIFKQVNVNIPLLDAIKQVPSYAEFLKDLCTVKRKLKVKKSAFMVEQVSTILSTNNKLKYKDPGCPIISCIIGDHKIEHALLDLGASVNLLPHSLYLQLNLGELKSTSTILLLADRSIKIPKGIMEDVLVQVDKFIYPVDFIVLETETVVNNYKPIPIILGRPFLATANALINCRNGLMNLSFGNMTLELNVFNMCRQANEENENEDEIVEQKELLCKSDDGKPKFEELGIIEKTEQQEAPKLELKPLPEGLKYAYLGKAQTYPVVISSTLSSDQGGKMPSQWNTQEKKKFLVEVKKFYWDDPYLLKYCPDQIFRRCIPDNEFVQAAVDLSHAIAERNLHLVYGGGDRGLSKLVSEAVFIRGNQVLDIIPQALKPLGCMSDVPIGEELVVLSMQERITEMLNHADAFIFLLGDLATLEALITLTS
ncbi:uncharacterized protein LOC112100799 [Citrus clementina]|uniref:uncharacterized protein LOC112100799 n=1 Tax=Citrus clementina TaxID=85681 RepID=UPI000CECE622|nr:uncharacterized protein LOC112100799 [Citrus x clementina]